jgi:hypothetical protein
MAKIDGKVHAHELIFIQSLALRMGLDGSGFQHIVKYPDLVPLRISNTETERFRQLCELIVLLNIDFDKNLKGLEFLEKHGVKLGFTTQAAQDTVHHFENNAMPEDTNALLKAF